MHGLFETHCHLMSSSYENLEVNKILRDAHEAGVSKLCCVGYDYITSKKAIDIAGSYPNLYAAIGIHPNEIKKHDANHLQWLRKMARLKNIVAIGEIGLDFFHKDVPKATQKEWFIEQLKIAKEFGLAVIIHCRDAYADCLHILKHYQIHKGIMHCFLGTAEEAKTFIKQGLLISFSGIITFKNASAKIIRTVKETPINSIVIETDSPYLAPVPYRGRINFPMYLGYVAKKVASLKNINYDELIRITSYNAIKVFGVNSD